MTEDNLSFADYVCTLYILTEGFEDYYPPCHALQKAYSALSTAFDLRRVLVDRMFKLKKSKNRVGTVFSHALVLLAGTDITHVFTIDTYLTKSMPEIMNLPIIRNYDSNLVGMYEFWAKYEHIFPYVRFYVPAEDCHAINRTTLQPLTTAAFAVATYASETFKYYRGPVRDSKLYKDIAAEVEKYLEKRMGASSISLLNSERAVISDLERYKLFETLSAQQDSSNMSGLARDLAAARQGDEILT